jgi:4-amino-4-deoxy-L-arabinose transferase-like glycosyltransferase
MGASRIELSTGAVRPFARLLSPARAILPGPILLFAFVALLFLARLGHRELYSSHEARAAQNAQSMIDTHAWGLPVLFDGRVDLQKPPGYYWAVAAVGSINGGVVDEWAARLPATLAGLLCVGLVFGYLWAAKRRTAAVVAALVLATATHFTAIARIARIDIPLTCAITASLLAFARGCETGRSLAWHCLAAAAAGIAVLLKGPVALALIVPAALVWPIVERRRIHLASWFLIPAVVVAIAAPWFIWANAATDGEFVRVFFWHHTIERYTGGSPLLASHPWWYYAPRFAFDFLPWTPLLAGAVVWAVRSGRWRVDPVLRFGIIVFTVMVVVLSTARFKRADYLLPAYPFAALAAGCAAQSWLETRMQQRSAAIARWLFGGTLAATAIAWVVMTTVIEPTEEAREEKRRFATIIRSQAPAPNAIIQFRMESHLLSYHLGRPLHTLVEWGELNERLAAPGPHFVVMPPEYVFATGGVIMSRKLVEVARLEDYTAAKPSRPLVFLRTLD